MNMALRESVGQSTVFYIDTTNYLKEMNNPCTENEPTTGQSTDISLSSKRFWSLFVFSYGSFISGLFFAEYAIIGDVIMSFFDVNLFEVSSTAIVFLLGFAFLLYPTNLLLQLKGMRFVLVLGITLITVGAWIRCAGLGPTSFWALILGHIFIALSQCCFLPVTTLFASTWFGPNEVSRACSVGIFSNILGVAFSCLIPPLLVTGKSSEEIKYQLMYLHISFAVASTIAFFMIIFGLQDSPESPPSLSQKQVRLSKEHVNGMLSESLLNLNKIGLDIMFNTNCMLQIVASGINFGIMNAIPTIMNDLILRFYPDANKDVGILGLLILLVGIPASLICGSLLDRTRKYREMYIITSIGCLLGYLFFMGCLYYNMISIYLSVLVLGFFQSAYLTVSLEFGAEISYPLPETASSGLIIGIGGLLGIAQTYFATYILQISGVLAGNMVIVSFYLLQTVISALIKSNLKRLKVNCPSNNRTDENYRTITL